MRFVVGVGAGLLVVSQTCAAQGTGVSLEVACENYRRQTGKIHPKCASVQAPRSARGAQTQPPGASAQRTAPVAHQQQLAEMPAPDRVLREITHADPLEALARQAGAFSQLETMVEVLSEGRNFRRQLTVEEERIIKSYRQARSAVYKQAHDLLPTGNPGEQPSPSVKWQNRAGRYDYFSNKPYQMELLQRFFSPSWQQYFLAIQTRQEQTVADREAKRRATEAKAREAPVPPIVVQRDKPPERRSGQQMLEDLVMAFVGAAQQRHAAECAKGPPKAIGQPLRGTYANETSASMTVVAVDFDCGFTVYCGEEETFREYKVTAGKIEVGRLTLTRTAEDRLTGPKDVMVTRTKPGESWTERDKRYQGYNQPWREVETTYVTPATKVQEPCKVGVLRKLAP